MTTRTLAALPLALLLAGAAHAPVVRAITPRPAATQGMAAPAPAMPEATAPAVAPILRPLAPWLPTFRQQALATGVPQALLMSVALVESSGRPWVTSSAGAVGLMGVLPSTAHSVGVWGAIEPTANIAAGSRYLAWLAQQVRLDGCWSCVRPVDRVLSGYNAGLHGRYQGAYVARVRRDWREIGGVAA